MTSDSIDSRVGSGIDSRIDSRIDLAELASECVPDPVPYAVLVPPSHGEGEPLPLCLSLHGGGGDRETLVAQKPLFDELFANGMLPPMVVATASTGEYSFYLDHVDDSERWETFITEDFIGHLREQYAVRSDPQGTVITGASMGGNGSLKIALRHPDRFAAVAALEPAIEPGLRRAEVGARNRFFHAVSGDGPLGPNGAPEFWEANNPATRAAANADAIRASDLAIYLEVGDEDCLNLHDGTEYLHRVLWDLDIPHEYRLSRGADHVGPSLTPRFAALLAWLGDVLRRDGREASGSISEAGRQWMAWAETGFAGAPPEHPLDMNSDEAIAVLRAQFEGARQEALENDPNTRRKLGRLPPTS